MVTYTFSDEWLDCDADGLVAYAKAKRPFQMLEWYEIAETEALAREDPRIRSLIQRGLIESHMATIREPPVWWTLTDLGRA